MSVVILQGDAASLPLPDASVDLIVTSPPFWGQRDYQDCGESLDGQIGNEGTPQEYIANLLGCTREWMRVLKPEGSLFVNLGDKYAARTGAGPNAAAAGRNVRPAVKTMVQPKSLLNLPHRYALGCTDELGLIERAEIVWSKTSGMPESVTDRVRRSHEMLFHFTRSRFYFSAVDEVRKPHAASSVAWSRRAYNAGDQFSAGTPNTLNPEQFVNPLGALPGSVWEPTMQPLIVPAHLGADHYAAYPVDLPKQAILGWSPSGICTACGEGRRPVVAKPGLLGGDNNPDSRNGTRRRSTMDGGREEWARRMTRPDRITGYACACPDASAPTRAAVVADPFGGTGTTALAASVLGRIGVSIDLSSDYSRIAQWRTSAPAERARALGVPKPPPVPEGQGSLFDTREAS